MKRFAAKVKKMPEIRIVTFHEDRATVLVDRAAAKTYVRINSLMDKINSKRFFGEPYRVVVRDNVAREEQRKALEGDCTSARIFWTRNRASRLRRGIG